MIGVFFLNAGVVFGNTANYRPQCALAVYGEPGLRVVLFFVLDCR